MKMNIQITIIKPIRYLIASFVLLCWSSLATSFEIAPFSLELEAKRFGTVDITLHGIQSLTRLKNNQWQYSLQTLSSFIKIIETSNFERQDSQIIPLSYRHFSRIAFVKKDESATFNSKVNQIIVKRKTGIKTYPLIAGIMDPSSFQIKLMEELTQGKTEFSYLIQDLGKQTRYDFRVVQQEKLTTPMGVLDVVKIEQVWNSKSSKQKYIWVSKDFGYIPLLIENYRDGKIVSYIRAKSGTYNGKAINTSVLN